jgi:hypothetical protein
MLRSFRFSLVSLITLAFLPAFACPTLTGDRPARMHKTAFRNRWFLLSAWITSLFGDRPTDLTASRNLDNTASLRGKPSIVVELGMQVRSKLTM